LHHRFGFLYTRVHRDFSSVPRDIKVLILGFFVYMVGWGVFDPFLSIYLHQTVGNYALAGFFYGFTFLIGFFLSVPVGDLSDKVNKISYVWKSMLFYPVVALLYFSLSLFSGAISVLLVFAARALHGAARLFWIPAEGFIREQSPKGETSAVFGLHITFYRLAYVIAPLFTIPLALFFGFGLHNLEMLLLFLIPLPIVSAAIISRIKDEGKPIGVATDEVIEKDGVFSKELADLRAIGSAGYLTLLMGFFMRSILIISLFLIPLYAVSLNYGIVEIALLVAFANAPYLLSFFFAELADSFGKINLIAVGFALAALFMVAIVVLSNAEIAFFLAVVGLGFILAMLQPAVNGLITDITPRVQDGEMTGLLNSVLCISSFSTALLLGFLSDAFSLQLPFFVFAVLLLAMAFVTYSIKGKVVVRI